MAKAGDPSLLATLSPLVALRKRPSSCKLEELCTEEPQYGSLSHVIHSSTCALQRNHYLVCLHHQSRGSEWRAGPPLYLGGGYLPALLQSSLLVFLNPSLCAVQNVHHTGVPPLFFRTLSSSHRECGTPAHQSFWEGTGHVAD